MVVMYFNTNEIHKRNKMLYAYDAINNVTLQKRVNMLATDACLIIVCISDL